MLDADPDEIVGINCSSEAPPKMDKPFMNALDIGMASLEIALNEIFVTGVREFLRINTNVREAAAASVTLHNEEGKPFKYYEARIIQPDEPLDDMLDFSQPAARRSMEAGREKAKQVLG